MRRSALAIAVLAGLWNAPLAARETVEASAPEALAVTLYRDPGRGADDDMDHDWPQGFAMITEKRTVTLPPGESTIRFEGVAEGMVAVSAIVTGLPGGTIEKNRNADLLSPGALVDGTLGNRVTVTRTNPATGEAVAEDAIVRTRADGGLVLQTSQGFEAVRCAGLPETLTFDRIPAGLSAQPVFSVDTRDPSGGTYTIELTYLAWGFDWQANYVATLREPGRGDRIGLRLMSWLTLVNDNGQSFENAELLVVAGRLNVVSDFESLADPPDSRPLSLTCYPLGSTAAGTPVEEFVRLPLPHLPDPVGTITVTAQRREQVSYDSPVAITSVNAEMLAVEEALGDLKLYRVPERVTVSANSLKQIAFLDQDRVEGRLLYVTGCSSWNDRDEARPATMTLVTVNDEEHGLGVALPMGGIAVFEPSSWGEQLLADGSVRDYAEGQDIELGLSVSRQVFAACKLPDGLELDEDLPGWTPVRVALSNANSHPVRVRVVLGAPAEWQIRGLRGTRLKDGYTIVEVTVPANGRREVSWEVRPAGEV